MSQAGRFLFGGGAGGPVDTLTGNAGGPVGPTGGNINIIGAGTITVTGNPGTSTLTISEAGTVATTYNTDFNGPAVPIAGVLNVFGVHGINTDTVAPGNTIDIAIDNVITLGDLASVDGAAAITLTTGNAVITAGNLTLSNTNTAGTHGEIQFGGNRWVSNYGTSNTFIGQNSGNTTLNTGSTINNVGIGASALTNLAAANDDNTAIGYQALVALNGIGGAQNVAVGSQSLVLATSAAQNTAIGTQSAKSLLTGTQNVAIGYLSGFAWNGAESSNIAIGAPGLVGTSHRIDIGSTQTTCFIAGIEATAAAGSTSGYGVYINQKTQLGSSRLNDGYVLIGATAGNPIGANLTAGFGVTITNAANSITVAASGSGGGLPWTDVFGAQAMVPNNGYVSDSGATIVFTLPATANFGDVLRVVGKGAGGWTITQNAGQIIIFGVDSTTVGVGGSLASTVQSDCIELLCTTGGANTFWTVMSCIGNITVV